MKNVTISMDEQLLHATRIEAAKAGKSVSRYISDTLATTVGLERGAVNKRNRQREALERFLNGPKLRIAENGRMPSAEERNARR